MISKKEIMLSRIKKVIGIIDKHGTCAKSTIIQVTSCSYSTCNNDVRRLINLRLITSKEGLYSLTARGHSAIVNEFKNLKYLEPHRVPTKNYNDFKKDDEARKNMLSLIFFMSITKPRIPCWMA